MWKICCGRFAGRLVIWNCGRRSLRRRNCSSAGSAIRRISSKKRCIPLPTRGTAASLCGRKERRPRYGLIWNINCSRSASRPNCIIWGRCSAAKKPQAGRYRQFHQFGVEFFGSDSPAADAEVISLAWEFYRRLGLKGLEVRLNSVGCPVCRAQHRAALQEYLKPRYEELCPSCKSRYEKNPLRIFDCKSSICQSIVAEAPTILDCLCDDCRTHFAGVKSYLTAVDIPYQLDAHLVRGLDYYTNTAFEILVEEIGAQSAICGGGALQWFDQTNRWRRYAGRGIRFGPGAGFRRYGRAGRHFACGQKNSTCIWRLCIPKRTERVLSGWPRCGKKGSRRKRIICSAV